MQGSGTPGLPARGPPKSQKKPLSIHSLKITTGTENGQIMKSYRESAEKYIKDHIVHQPYANTIYSADQMTGYLKAVFHQVCRVHRRCWAYSTPIRRLKKQTLKKKKKYFVSKNLAILTNGRTGVSS